MGAFIAPIISGVGSLLGGILGGNSARNAGRTIGGAGTAIANQIWTDAAGGKQAIGDATQAGEQNFDWAKGGVDQANQWGQSGINQAVQGGQQMVSNAAQTGNDKANQLLQSQMGNLNPYLQTGQTGTSALQGYVQNPFQAPTADQAAQTPGFQFQLQQGLNGLEQQLGASGGGATGGALKALTQYGQGVASTYYQNAFNNSLNAYNANVNTAATAAGQGLQGSSLANQAQQNYGNIFNQNTMNSALYNSNLGYSGASQNANLGMQAAGLDANLLTGKSNFQLGGTEAANNFQLGGDVAGGNFFMNGAQGTAAGQLGQANAWSGAANGIGNAFMSAMPYSMGGTNPYGGGAVAGQPSGWGSWLPPTPYAGT